MASTDARRLCCSVIWAAAVWAATALIVVMGGSVAGTDGRSREVLREAQSRGVWHDWSMRGDGNHFVDIARNGYAYDPAERSTLAFFPVFPLTGRAIVAAIGVTHESALLLAANAYFLGALVLLGLYASHRFGEAGGHPTGYALLAFGLFPTTFFFRADYSESSFLFFTILAVFAMERGSPLVAIALVVGAATATRPVGVALVPVFLISVWQRSAGWRQFAIRSTFLLPLALWGLIAYMVYQYHAFGQPFAFAMTQEHWSFRQPVPLSEKVIAFLSHEPIWSVYDPSSEAFWQRIQREPRDWSNLALANPIYFLLGVGLVIVGRLKKYLNAKETVLASLLILIPYLTRGFEMCMLSQGRFIAAVFPIYLVIGQLLSRCPPPVAAIILCFSAVVMAVYAAEFAAGYMLI